VSLTTATFIYGRAPGALSLVDAILVTYLPFVVTIGAVASIITILRGKPALKLAYLLHLVLCTIFGLIVWVQVKTYGATPGCNSSVQFVVFGQSINPTSKGLRGFAIFNFAFQAFCIPILAVLLAGTTPPTAEERKHDRFAVWLGWVLVVIVVPSWVIIVVTVEQIIQRNGLSGATNKWTYGQTFAAVLLIGPFADLGSAIWRRLTQGWGDRCPRCSIDRV
jgi:hypothetical protein